MRLARLLGARPKASLIDQHGHLSIAKFPKETDEYSMETWEEVALRLAEYAGIVTPHHKLLRIAGKSILLSRRFDRAGATRIPFLSAMAMTGSKDGETGSYPEIIDAITQRRTCEDRRTGSLTARSLQCADFQCG